MNFLDAAEAERSIRVVQFGQGNLLRAFVDYMIDIANEKGVFAVKDKQIGQMCFGGLKG